MVDTEHKISDNIHRLIARSDNGNKIALAKWFTDDIRIRFSETDIGGTVVLDFGIGGSVTAKPEISFDADADGNATYVNFSNSININGLQSIYARLEGVFRQTKAAVTVVLTTQTVTSVTVNNRGNNYVTPPVLVVVAGGGGGSGATVEAVLGTGFDEGRIIAVNVLTPGSNYGTVPTITVPDPPGGDAPLLQKEVVINFRIPSGESAIALVKCTLSEV